MPEHSQFQGPGLVHTVFSILHGRLTGFRTCFLVYFTKFRTCFTEFWSHFTEFRTCFTEFWTRLLTSHMPSYLMTLRNPFQS